MLKQKYNAKVFSRAKEKKNKCVEMGKMKTLFHTQIFKYMKIFYVNFSSV